MTQPKSTSNCFHLRAGFRSFRLTPETDGQYLFGEPDRRVANDLLTRLEGAGYSEEGIKQVLYGDFGRGKTHLIHYLIDQIEKKSLPFRPQYVKFGAYAKKQPFRTLMRSLVFPLTEDMAQVAWEYAILVSRDEAEPLTEVVACRDVAHVLEAMALVKGSPEDVVSMIKYLGGDPKAAVSAKLGVLNTALTEVAEYGAVLRAMTHMFARTRGQVLLYFMDEGEYLKNITDPDTYYFWVAALRELTEIPKLGLMISAGARDQDELPNMLLQPEVVRRIGTTNYLDYIPQADSDIRSFLLELFQTMIRKGPLPESQRDAVISAARDDETVPAELTAITEADPLRLEAYPFDPDALEQLVDGLAGGSMTNKPSEALSRLLALAGDAMRLGRKSISREMVEKLESGV